MLGLKLNHVSKRGHMNLDKYHTMTTINHWKCDNIRWCIFSAKWNKPHSDCVQWTALDLFEHILLFESILNSQRTWICNCIIYITQIHTHSSVRPRPRDVHNFLFPTHYVGNPTRTSPVLYTWHHPWRWVRCRLQNEPVLPMFRGHNQAFYRPL